MKNMILIFVLFSSVLIQASEKAVASAGASVECKSVEPVNLPQQDLKLWKLLMELDKIENDEEVPNVEKISHNLEVINGILLRLKELGKI
jgi:hypothetical protein